jgi:hypothetical protein
VTALFPVVAEHLHVISVVTLVGNTVVMRDSIMNCDEGKGIARIWGPICGELAGARGTLAAGLFPRLTREKGERRVFLLISCLI